MKSLSVRISFLLRIVSLMVAVIACDEQGGAEGGDPTRVDSTKSDSVVSHDLPQGRFELPTAHTPAPDFYITLPEGYTIKNNSRMPNDDFFIVRLDDPSLTDSTAITPGFMRVYVGVNAQSGLDAARRYEERGVMIARMPVTWRLWSDTLPDRSAYYYREIASSDFFAPLSPELARSPLHLHIYVAGRDSARVAELLAAAETLSLAP
jgi:hypothetical protein